MSVLSNTNDTSNHVNDESVKVMIDVSRNLEFSMNKLVSSTGSGNTEEIISRLQSFVRKYEQMSIDIQSASKLIDRSSEFAETQIKSAVFLHCRRNLHDIHASMNAIDTRIGIIQQKLNTIRKQLPPRKHSLVEPGPFYYKCVYAGGVRYRDYPSNSAKVVSDDAVVTVGQVVEIIERVFIASEHSVFLHCEGSGWLFENKKDITCFIRTSPPSA